MYTKYCMFFFTFFFKNRHCQIKGMKLLQDTLLLENNALQGGIDIFFIDIFFNSKEPGNTIVTSFSFRGLEEKA